MSLTEARMRIKGALFTSETQKVEGRGGEGMVRLRMICVAIMANKKSAQKSLQQVTGLTGYGNGRRSA